MNSKYSYVVELSNSDYRLIPINWENPNENYMMRPLIVKFEGSGKFYKTII